MRISDWSSDVCSSDLRANVEEVQFLRAPRRHRGARERLAPGERVQERRLADVRAARERDLGNGSVGQKLQRRRGLRGMGGPTYETQATKPKPISGFFFAKKN